MASFDPELGRRDVIAGLDDGVVGQISRSKGEPTWMAEMRAHSLRVFDNEPWSEWLATATSDIGFESICFLPRSTDERFVEWEHDPDQAVEFNDDSPGAPDASGRTVAGGTGQLEFDIAAHERRRVLLELGVVFCDMDAGLRDHPELIKEYFGTVVSPGENKFAALNSAVWSGGVFIYVPPGVEVDLPLQTSLQTRSEHPRQFERTLIVADEGSKVHYIEGCSAPVYTSDSLHSAVVEIVVKSNAQVAYTSIQNWSPNVCNLVAKGARVEAEGRIVWTECNVGARLTATAPTVRLVGAGAEGEMRSVAFAGEGQLQETGATVVHVAPNTASKIMSKSISTDGGIVVHNGMVRLEGGADVAQSHVECDALVLDEYSTAESAPVEIVGENDALGGSDVTVAKVADEQLFYLMSRGISREQALALIVSGFIAPVLRTLPTEYAVEWSRLIELQMEGSVG